ncbi:hypothetical protein LOK49_LG07G03356 [Camellia lanceoleosa]|uniref:Uncharacterized protein n=1 Tax=Camellia lanceoleosa TaxID=1840588 RepID=A0ACC0H3M8_9ERIC|nr:hypothetical protein LOK49_LG07G03356 [Camellia lanceoleosa]
MPENAYEYEEVPLQPEKYDDGGVCFETNEHEDPSSQASLEYLCRSHLDALFASIAEIEKQTELAARVYSAARQLMFSTGETQETAKNDFIGCLKVLEGELGDKPYFGGETFSIVDVALIPSYSFFFAYEQFGNFSIVAECSALVAWVNRCMEKESVSKHLPDQHKVYDYISERKKKLESK